MSSVVFFANGFGDTVMNRPALAALARYLPRPVTLVCSTGPHGFLLADLGFDRVEAVPMQTLAIGRSFDVERVAEAIGSCEVFIDLVPWSSAHVRELACRLHAAKTIGFGDGYGISVPRDISKNAVALGFDLALTQSQSLQIRNFRAMPSFSDRAQTAVGQLQDWLKRSKLRALMSVQADTFAHKLWSTEGFRHVLGLVLSERVDLGCVVVGSQPPPIMLRAFENRMVSLDGFSLESSMAVVSASDVFLGIDSCMLHMADLAGVSGTALFGPATDPTQWGYYWTAGEHVRFDHIDDLTIVDEVVDSVLGQISRS